MSPSKLIAFEGIDGCGKTAYVDALYDWMQNEKCKLVMRTSALSENSTLLGRDIGNLLRSQSTGIIDPIAEALMIAAARRDNWQRIINPLLKRENIWVITDRHLDSLYCYQNQVPDSLIDDLLRISQIDQHAALTFLIDVPNDFHWGERNKDDRLEDRTNRWWRECGECFRKRFSNRPRSFVVNNAKSFDEGFAFVKAKVEELMREINQHS